jgi:predicted dehydrogenase
MDKLKLIQCGVGGFGKGWVENYSSRSTDFDLVAIVDLSVDNLADARKVTGLPEDKCFASLEAALEKVEADAVLSVTPPLVHAQHARLAFARGLHFMCEKPLADSIANAREMIALAATCHKQLAVSQNYRFRPFIQKLKTLLHEKTVGEFGHGHMDFYIPADFTGTFRETMEYPLLLDMAIHHFDLIRCVTGRDITKVLAWSFKPSWSWYAHEPGLKMLLELDGGLPFSYSGDWSARGKSTSWNGNWRLQCAQGALLFENDEVFIARNERWSQNETIESVVAPALEQADQAATLHLFAEAIRSGQPNEISGCNNFASFAAVQAAIESAQQGRAVAVAPSKS